MIEINLLPGAGKKPRRGLGITLGGSASGLLARIKDPYLIGATVAAALAIAAVGAMHWSQQATAASLAERLQSAEQDSIRFAAVIREKHSTEVRRDSVLKQFELIRSIDSKRFIWPHIMDEVSRALPPYTWLTSLVQLSPAAIAAQASSGEPDKKSAADSAAADSAAVARTVQFRVVGNTVDIQALTRFMRLLEASPFIEDVQLVKSALIILDGKEVTEFQLDAGYQSPDSSVIRTAPVAIAVR